MSIYIKASSTLINYDLEFQRRINFIIGNGGVGKTSLANLVSTYNKTNDSSIFVDSSYPISVIDDLATWKNAVPIMHDTIYIFDGLKFAESGLFANMVTKYSISNNLWFIIMTREDSEILNRKTVLYSLSYSINSVYTLVGEKDKRLKRYYGYTMDNSSTFDYVLTEDKGAGFRFFKSLFGDIVHQSSEGKSKIVEDILSAVHQGFKRILVLFDTATFGCHMNYFNTVLSYVYDADIVISSYYECFEELLSRTNMLSNNPVVQKELANLEGYANNFISWENYFEDLIGRATEGKMYRYTHGRLSILKSCYTEPCDLCPVQKREKCDVAQLGDKFEYLLKGTKYDWLLELRNALNN